MSTIAGVSFGDLPLAPKAMGEKGLTIPSLQCLLVGNSFLLTSGSIETRP